MLENKAYFKRFQVKNRGLRDGKTDLWARRKRAREDKNKFANRRCICQMAYATIRGDMTIAQANSN